MKFFAIRHGITESNKKKLLNGQIDEPLLAEGFEQAKKAIAELPKSIKQIYVSPLLRTRQTAETINAHLKIPMKIAHKIKEIHIGDLAGKAWTDFEDGAELKKKHRSIQFDYSAKGGETAEEVKKRLVEFLKEINNKHHDHEVLLVTHGGILRALHMLEHKKENLDEIENVSLHTFDTDSILI